MSTEQILERLITWQKMLHRKHLSSILKEYYGKKVIILIDEYIEPDATPQPYWINTSGNYIVKRFIEKANQQTRREIEQLIEGKAIQKEIRLELTYNELDSTIENLWSALFATGYLTQQGKPQGKTKTA